MTLRQYIEYERSTVDRWVRNLLINILPDFWIINRIVRPAVARLCGMKCGAAVILQKPIFYGNPKNITIGNHSAILRGVFLDAYDKITIGNNVAVAFQVTIITSSHEIASAENRVGKLVGKPVVIEDGAWIAARVTIGPGTKVGAGSLVVPGTTLMRSVPPNSVVAGVPGKVITHLIDGPGSNRPFGADRV
jgi:maltose O-acetyltransferase